MALTPGTRFGHYEITGTLGAGGMGEVYRARDTELGRDVAIKVLPASLIGDSDRISRLRREAEVLASLNHPNIAQIYGLERVAGDNDGSGHADEDGAREIRSLSLIMELVEGPTLADRIAQGPIPVDEALGIAMQIADALEAAHGKQIIHRDLKPANVKLTPDGLVKLLDFGIAKMPEPAGTTSGGLTPTLMTPALTEAGVLLGTAAYMAPEQAKGRPVDQRADVWAFGCVLYEMLTGQSAFGSEDVTTTLARVLEREPNLGALPVAISPPIRHTIALCLEKDPRNRIRHIGDVRLALKGAFESDVHEEVSESAMTPLWRRALPLAAGLVIGVMAATVLPPTPQSDMTSRSVTRFDMSVAASVDTANSTIAVTPDGTAVVYVGGGDLYVRPIDDFESRLLTATDADRAWALDVSPDSLTVVYWEANSQELKRTLLAGGPSTAITSVPTRPTGIHWAHNGTILYAIPDGIMQVSASGGAATLVVAAREGEEINDAQLLPDDDSVLFTSTFAAGLTRWDVASIVVQSISTGERDIVVERGRDATYLSTGHLLYAVDDQLLAAIYDQDLRSIVGAGVPVLDGIAMPAPFTDATATAQYDVSTEGTLVYLASERSLQPVSRLVIADRSGGREPLPIPAGPYVQPRVSRDGRLLAYGRDEREEAHIWVYELGAASAPRRVTFEGQNRYPIWSPDAQIVVFQSSRAGDAGIFARRVDGQGETTRLTNPPAGVAHFPESWSPDGRHLLFSAQDSRGFTLWDLDVETGEAAQFGTMRPAQQTHAAFSPEGRWVAYHFSDTWGPIVNANRGIYVEPYPPSGARYQVPQLGVGTHPTWLPDGTGVLFGAGRQSFAEAGLRIDGTLSFSTPEPIAGFPAPEIGYSTLPRSYDVLPDGRIVILQPETPWRAVDDQRLAVVRNWFEELNRLVPRQ